MNKSLLCGSEAGLFITEEKRDSSKEVDVSQSAKQKEVEKDNFQ